ncbi:sensor histidine kinase [Kocuria marina]|uniref:sensor histidine kinase n=1 Tax=Kocuria marina TaxID=223184 RepID=UPI0022E830DB|nr:histidine kinase [Kocuria marina]
MTTKTSENPAVRGTARASDPNPDKSTWPDVLYASVWLVFLFFPASGVLSAPVSSGTKALGLTGLGLFAALYVISWLLEYPFPRRSERTNALFWCLVLLLPLALVVPAAGLAVTYVAPFFVAVCIFRLSMRGSLVSAAVVLLVASAPWLLTRPPHEWGWPLIGTLPAVFLLLISRWMMERSEVQEELKRELELARQREAVGRDVHDILGHSLTVVSMKVQLAQRLLPTDPQRAAQELDDVLVLTRDSLTDVRSTVGKLREPELSVQLVQARAALRSAGITPHLPDTVPSIDPARRSAFAWILREAVTNTVRHSAASSCRVTLTPTTLTVTDDGMGLARADDDAVPAPRTDPASRTATDGAIMSSSRACAASDGAADVAGSGRSGDDTGPGRVRNGAAAASSSVLRGNGLPGNGLRGMRERAEAAGLRLTVTSPVAGTDGGMRIVVEPA